MGESKDHGCGSTLCIDNYWSSSDDWVDLCNWSPCVSSTWQNPIPRDFGVVITWENFFNKF